jgi:acyl transferase domain-containing protein/NADPH:quinone reductase-like Zn-dependent oxidoreductase/SAM-dependent methyltransferase/acyl carrier protein
MGPNKSVSPQGGGPFFPLAIVGMSCRFPGGVEDVESFWSLLAEGRSGICEVPPNRWDRARYCHPDGRVSGTMVTPLGGFVDNLDEFDARFWGISPREAMRMDPQQRWLLEVAWEALEDSGTPPRSLRGTPVGVFIGISKNDYASLQLSNLAQTDVHTMSGSALSIAANRLSYLLDLKGPSLAVDTACSSALVGVWMACRSIWSGSCCSALVGGANALILPYSSIGFSKAWMLSPSGQCFSFDARANGYVRGEGAAIAYIKPLERALADQDRIYAVIRMAVSNQDGHTSAMSVPGVEGQAALLRQAYQEAGLAPGRVVYVEAHGTGTPVGDPIEATALGTVLGEGRPANQPCLLGSVKTNIGHLEACSGMAGLIKAALILHKDTIPPSLNFETPNPHIPFQALGLAVATRVQPLPHQDGLAPVTAVNSFGFGGSNAHVVLEQAPQTGGKGSGVRSQESEVRSQGPQAKGLGPPHTRRADASTLAVRACLLPISARDEDSLRRFVESYRAFLADPALDLADACYCAGARREHHDHRLVVIGNTADQMRQRLGAWLHGADPEGVVIGRTTTAASPQAGSSAPVFVYTGQGGQWWAMGRKLLEHEPIFRATVAEIADLLKPLAGWSLMNEMTRDEAQSKFDRTDYAQPALFALQVALTRLWQSWGVQSAKVVGHSAGEVAAAYVAGVYSLADAVKVIFHRSRLQHTTAGRGRMLAVGISAIEAGQLIGAAADQVQIAVFNSPHQVTLGGDTGALEELAARLQQTGTFLHWLPMPYAFHTRYMDPIKDELLQVLEDLRPQPARIPFVSTVTGVVLPGERLDGGYWWKNVRQQVQFAPAIASLIRGQEETFLEVGPHPALASAINECLNEQGRSGNIFHSLRRGADEVQELLTNLAGLHVHGVPLDWAAVNQSQKNFIRLPSYPWHRQSFWLEAHHSQQNRLAPLAHPLLGMRISAVRPTWQVELDSRRLSYLNDHVIADRIVLPGVCYAEIGIALSHLLFPDEPHAVEDLDMRKVLYLSNEQPLTVQVVFDLETKTYGVYSNSADQETWELHAQGQLTRVVPGQGAPVDLVQLRERLTDHRDHDTFYQNANAAGYQFGPNFKQVRNVWAGPREAVSEITVPDALVEAGNGYHIHPVVLDACIQVTMGLKGESRKDHFFWPRSIRRVHLGTARPPAHLWVHGQLLGDEGQSMVSDIFVYDDQGWPVAQVLGFRMDWSPQNTNDGLDGCFYRWQWQQRRLRSSAVQGSCCFPSGSAIVAAARSGIRDREDQERHWSYLRFASRADALACVAIHKAWLELGWQPRLGERFTSRELIERLAITSAYHRLVHMQLRNLTKHGWLLAKADDTWEVARVPDQADLNAQWDLIAAEYPLWAPEVALHRRTGPKLAAVLSGHADAVEVLFPGGSPECVERLYADELNLYAPLIASAFARLLEALPNERVVRVLEVGGGTGSFTRLVLPLLPADRTEYVFTDVSSWFLGAAKKKFADYPFVTCRHLDIEKDPTTQGVESGSFDLIVGTLVLHATDDLKRVLGHLHSCLAEGGLLLFQELFPRRIAWENIFGLLSGWWRFTDTALRPHSPLLQREQWLGLLTDCGFCDPGSFSCVFDEADAEQGFVFARAPFRKEMPQQSDLAAGLGKGNYVVFADRGGVADALTARLRQSGHRVVQVLVGHGFRQESDVEFVVAPDAEADLRQVFASLACPISELSDVIHCWSLDHPRTGGLSLEDLWAAQQTGVLSALKLVHVISHAPPPRLWFVTRDVCRVQDADRSEGLASAPLVGLLRVANNEYFPSRFALIDLDATPDPQEIGDLFHEVTGGDGELEIVYRGGRRHVLRLERASIDQLAVRTFNAMRPFSPHPPALQEVGTHPLSKDGKHVGEEKAIVPFRLQTSKPGVLTNLSLNETQRCAPGPGEIEIRVRAGGINFRDVMKALGTYPGNPRDRLWFGNDVAGTVTCVGPNVGHLQTGDEVVSLVSYGFRSYVTTDARRVFLKPAHMSFEQAATLPTVFATAHYALQHVARMRRGEKILIHAGAGGVGQAAIQVAKHLGLEILATAGTEEKRRFLHEMGVHHVMNSRTLEFADEVRKITEGRGVDAVLNSLGGDFIPKSLSVLAPFGRFLEIGKVDIFKNTKIGMDWLKNGISFHVIDLAGLLEHQPAFAATLLDELSERFATGDYQPLPYQAFPITQVEEAFRYMAQAKHVGKNVLTFDLPQIRIGPCTEDGQRFRSDATYLITGGASGVGLEVAKWLSRQGARHLVLFSRSGPRDEAAAKDIEQFQHDGIRVLDARGDVGRFEDVKRIVARIQQEMPPLAGVIHAAMVLEDAALVDLDDSGLSKALGPKMAGAWNLHLATAEAPLEHFICFSSLACILGVRTQANYNAGNYFLDALACYRRARGLPALTINWGALLGAGYLERHRQMAEALGKLGVSALTTDEALSLLGKLTLRDPIQIAAARVNWEHLPKFCPMIGQANTYTAVAQERAETEQGGSLLSRLQRVSPDARPALAEDFVAAQVGAVLGIAAEKVDRAASLGNLGLDSLTAVELANRLQGEIRIPVPMNSLYGEANIKSLAQSLLRLLAHAGPADQAASAAPAAAASLASVDGSTDQGRPFQIVASADAGRVLAQRRFDAAALFYLPDKFATIGRLNDDQLQGIFGSEPFVSNYLETCLGSIAIVTLPFRSQAFSRQDEVRAPIVRGIELAGRYGARFVSLTGLIPSLTNYGADILGWLDGRPNCPALTTGHATTTAAVIRSLEQMLGMAGRELQDESLAVLGLGSIGQSCLRLLLEVCPHPRELILCDVFAKEQIWQGFAEDLRAQHGFRGPIRLVSSRVGAAAEVYEATTILTAVSVPDVLDVDRLRPGTLVVDDSYPPAFSVERGMRRLEEEADIFFSNAGILRLPAPIRETLVVPAGTEDWLPRFVGPYREEMVREPHELTACVLSSLLTARSDGTFPPTLGLAGLTDLLSHYHELQYLDIGPARPQCDKYFVPEQAVERFRRRFGRASHGNTQRRQQGSPATLTDAKPVDRLPYFDMIFQRLREADEDFALAFGRHVHWGFWEDPAQADGSVADFARASERLCQRLLASAALGDGQDILDAGCGFGGTLATINEQFAQVRLTGINIDERQLDRARTLLKIRPGNTLAWVHGDACALRFPDASFDRVLAVECIFHFPSRRRFFREARRVLRRGGCLTLSDLVLAKPTAPEVAAEVVEPLVRIYGPSSYQTIEEYEQLARATGFRLTSIDDLSAGLLPSFPVARRLLGRVSAAAAWATAMSEAKLAAAITRYVILTFGVEGEAGARTQARSAVLRG